MSANSQHTSKYNADDIRRYVNGGMTAAEMHAIEMAALEDPFLADAIEGYTESITTFGEPATRESENNLQLEFKKRLKEEDKNVVPVAHIKWWQGVAAASIIIIAGILGYNAYNDRSEQAKISMNDTMFNANKSSRETSPEVAKDMRDEVAQEPVSTVADSTGDLSKKAMQSKQSRDVAAATALSALPQATNSELPEESKLLKASTPKSNAAVDDEKDQFVVGVIPDSGYRPAKVQSKAIQKDLSGKVAGVIINPEKESKVNRAAPASLPEMSANSDRRRAMENEKQAGRNMNNAVTATNNRFSGQIVTDDKRPLSNAVLTVTNDQTSFSTDNNGRFNIASPDSVIEVDVTIVGQQPKRFTLKKDDQSNVLVLPPSGNQLDEVVIVGYGTSKNKELTAREKRNKQQAQPIGGWSAFDKYVETNRDSTLINDDTEETVVNFYVSPFGVLSNFRITKSISTAHDKEVVRLLKEGPKWTSLTGKRVAITVTITF